MAKELWEKVRFWDKRKCWVFDARGVGLHANYGNYATKDEAVEAARVLASQHTLGILQEQPKKILGADMAAHFMAFNEERVLSGELGYDSCQNIKRTMRDRLLKVKIDGKPLAKVDLGKVCVLQNKAQLALQITNALRVRGKSAHTQKSWFTHAKHFFSYCIERGYISSNPLQEVKFTVGGEAVEDSIAPMVQRDTVRKILDGVNGESLRSRAMVWLSAETGIRQGELRALRLCDVDRQARTIRVEGAIKSGTLDRGKPKTKYGRRTIAYGDGFAKLLPELLLSLKYNDAEDLLFQTRSGKPMSRKTIHNLMQRIIKAAGVDHFNWKALRHAYATMQLNGLGNDSHHTAKLMGHHNSSFTESQYGHTFEDASKQEKARSVINGYLHC